MAQVNQRNQNNNINSAMNTMPTIGYDMSNSNEFGGQRPVFRTSISDISPIITEENGKLQDQTNILVDLTQNYKYVQSELQKQNLVIK